MKNKRVVITNSGSCFRGLTGTATRETARGMIEVTFDQPFHTHSSALFFPHELKEMEGTAK